MRIKSICDIRLINIQSMVDVTRQYINMELLNKALNVYSHSYVKNVELWPRIVECRSRFSLAIRKFQIFFPLFIKDDLSFTM